MTSGRCSVSTGLREVLPAGHHQRRPFVGTLIELLTPALVVQSATTGEHRQLLTTVEKVALESEHAGFGAPAIVVIGEVAALSDKLAWFKTARSLTAAASASEWPTSS